MKITSAHPKLVSQTMQVLIIQHFFISIHVAPMYFEPLNPKKSLFLTDFVMKKSNFTLKKKEKDFSN